MKDNRKELYDGGGMPDRRSVDKSKSARKFQRDSARTHEINVKPTGVMRGGIRM